MEIILNEKELALIDKTLQNQSIDLTTNGYQYFEVKLKGTMFNSFFDEIHISVLVEVDQSYYVEYCQLVNTEERDAMPIENFNKLKLLS